MTFGSTPRFIIGLASTVALTVTLAACSSSSTTGGPVAGSTGTTLTTTSTRPAAQATTATCDQLTVDQLQPMASSPLTKAPSRTIGLNDHLGQDCAFDVNDDEDAFDVVVLPDAASGEIKDAGMDYDSAAKSACGADPVAVSGVGSKACRAQGDISVLATNGSLSCSVSAEPQDMPDLGAWELSHGGTSTVPDSIADPAVAVIGTICNRIFGSGNTTPDLAALKAAIAAAS